MFILFIEVEDSEFPVRGANTDMGLMLVGLISLGMMFARNCIKWKRMNWDAILHPSIQALHTIPVGKWPHLKKFPCFSLSYDRLQIFCIHNMIHLPASCFQWDTLKHLRVKIIEEQRIIYDFWNKPKYKELHIIASCTDW